MDNSGLVAVGTADALFLLARKGSLCELVSRIDELERPPADVCALRVFGLLSSGDIEAAMVRMAHLFEQVRTSPDKAPGLLRWATMRRGWRRGIEPYAAVVERFFETWDHQAFWRALTAEIAGHELDFIAAVLSAEIAGFRLLVAVADAFKLRREWRHAYPIYLSMQRVEPSPSLLHNVFTLALDVEPGAVPALVQEFHVP